MRAEYADAATRYAADLDGTLAAMEAHRRSSAEEVRLNWGRPGMTPAPALPVVTLTVDDRAMMDLVDVRSLRHQDLRNDEDAGIGSWDEMFLAWSVHSRTHFGCSWRNVDGSPLMYSHVASALHILRTYVLQMQHAAAPPKLAA